jgi:aromatic-L-amino-acid/L-tryptophan decarboxylase
MPDDQATPTSPATSPNAARATAPDPNAPDPRPSAAARFGWHPEPGLIGLDDEATARPALERLGRDAWAAALDYLYDEAFRRAMGEPTGYAELRRTFFAGQNPTPNPTPDRAVDGSGGETPPRDHSRDRPIPGPAPAPSGPTTSAALLEEFRTRLAPHLLNSWHPRTLSYFTPPPLTWSIVGELLAQWTNQGIDVWHAGPTGAFVEEEVGRWLCDLIGFGPGAFAVLTSGGVMANFMAMTVARDIHLARALGLTEPPRGRQLEGVRVYASDQTHFSIARALDELGFPPDTLHLVPADADFRLRGAPVAEAVAADRAAGLTPFAIAAVAGSTNTGSVDRTGELAEVAGREGLWLHVDAAYGGAARLSRRDAGRVPDLERADSVTIDPHKWFFQAYDLGALVVRRERDLLETFQRSPEYYRGGETTAGPAQGGPTEGGPAEGGPADDPDPHADQLNYYQRSMEGTRRFRALKLWLSWKHLGTEGLGRLVEANDDLAGALAERIAASDDFEAIPAVPELSVVCFRHLPGGRASARALEPAILDAHQDALAAALEASGDGWLSTTTILGATYLRAGIVNYLTTEADLDRLLAALRRLGAELRPG